jgi:acyl-CoA thioesterase-1
MAYGLSRFQFNHLTKPLIWLLALFIMLSPPAVAAPKLIIAFGDSLTAGLGLAQNEAFPARLEAALAARGIAARVENAGVSGDTTAGGRARLGWILGERTPDLVILELGANDALRGLPPEAARDNLEAMLALLKRRRIPVLLTGMIAPPNLGAGYGAAFNRLYPALAQKYAVPLYPFFLDGVAGKPALNQADGLHPTAAGVTVIVKRIMPWVLGALNVTE